VKANHENTQRILIFAQNLANQRTDEGLHHAARMLLQVIHGGCNDPEILVTAASYLLQGPGASKLEIKKNAVSLVDKAMAQNIEKISILEMAIECYELVLHDFPDKIKDILRLCLKVLDLDPEHANCMVTLARHRKDPNVALSLEDTIRMLEWAHDVEPMNKTVDLTLYELYIEKGMYDKAHNIYDTQPLQSLQSKSHIKRHRKFSRN